MEKSIFTLEACVRMDRVPNLLPTLRSAITGHPATTGHQEKWAIYRMASQALLANLGMIERGCWEYFDDTPRANDMFDNWLAGMTKKETARQAPSGVADPYRGDPRYLTFTMVFSLVRPSPTSAAMARLCNIGEQHLWRRDVFGRLLEGMGVINFASVISDVMYLVPRDGDWGLTVDDLAQPKFHYLRVLQG